MTAPANVETRVAPPLVPWKLLHKWHDPMQAEGTATFIDGYHDWVKANYKPYVTAQVEYLCNWWPLRLLVDYAALKGLPVRLNCWPGTAQVSGENRKRSWTTNQLVMYASHDGTYATKSKYYGRVSGRVTARMIGTQADEPRTTTYKGRTIYQRDEGQLAPTNTVRVADGSVRPGDIVSIAHYGLTFWHCQVVVNLPAKRTADAPQRYTIIQGNTPKAALEQDTVDYPAAPDRVVRWNFAQFDA